MISFLMSVKRFGLRFVLFLIVVFVLPALAHLGVWSLSDHPTSWRHANWSSANILPKIPAPDQAEFYVLTARTGGVKGAFATHSWLVLKPLGANRYDRYDVVGWGRPVRKNAYDADAYWYSNTPVITYKVTGKDAERLIFDAERAITNYPWRERGDYTIWPGPNSNTFVAEILRQASDFSHITPPTAVGRDFPVDGRWIGKHDNGTIFATLGGYLGVSIGGGNGFELNFLGLVAGFNLKTRQVYIPAFGAFDVS